MDLIIGLAALALSATVLAYIMGRQVGYEHGINDSERRMRALNRRMSEASSRMNSSGNTHTKETIT